MKRIARSSSPSLFCLRICFLVYMLAIISTFSSAEINKRNRSRATYAMEGFDSIKNSKKSAISPYQHGNNKVDGNRNHSANESLTISDHKNSVALNRFLEDVMKAQNDLKLTDHATHRINHRARLNDQYTNQDSTVSVDTENVLGRADIGYGSRLRGKRGFDRNYETMWMLQKKKYGGKNTRNVPQRVYLDNDMTFKSDTDGADFDALYRSRGTLDRAVYQGEAMADQPLKDWTRKKDLYSSGDWSNSNENFKVTNGDRTWFRDYKPDRKILFNSDPSKDKKLHVDAETRDRSEIVSLYDPIYANDFTALRESPAAIRNGKSRNISLSLESLKKTVLELRKSLTLGNKKGNRISRGESNWWDESQSPRSAVEIFDFERNLEDHPDEETMWRIKRAKSIGSEDESDSRIFQGVELEERNSYLGERNSKESHDRSKRSRRSFIRDLNYTNNQTDISENKGRQKTQMIKDALGNATNAQNAKEVQKLYFTYLNDDGKNSINAPNKANISNSHYSDEGFFLNDHSINLTFTPPVANKTNISELRYPLRTKPYLNNYSIDNKSLFLIKIDLQTYSPEYIAMNEVPRTNSNEIGQRSAIETILKNISYLTKDRINSSYFEKNFPVSNVSTDSICLSTNDGTDDSRRFAKDRSDEEKLGVAARKISRFATDDGQLKGAGVEFPRGNTPRGFDNTTNESRSCVVETTVAARRGEIEANRTRKENREPIPGVIKVFEPRGRPYQKQEAETATRLSRRMVEEKTCAEKMKTNDAESRNANAREDSSVSPIDLVKDATAKPEASNTNTLQTGESIILKYRHEDFTSMTVDNDLRKQQQMVPPLSSAENRNANKSNGNSDIDRIDIRALGSNGNETMNVKEGAPNIMEAHEYHESDNNLRRKLLWISVDAKTNNSFVKNTKSIVNTTTDSHIENVVDDDQQQSEVITSSSENSRKILTRVKRESSAEESPMLQDALNSQISETNHYARYKRSTYPFENLESNNEANPENVAIEKKAAINQDEKQENNEEYLNQNIEGFKGDYSDREEDAMEDNDKAMENEREDRSSSRQKINPLKAKVDMLIKQKLEKKNKDRDDYRRKRRSMLDMIEYYDYDEDEERERDAPIDEHEIQSKDDKLSIEDKVKIKRDGKTTCKPGDLGKKKNENAEAMMKEEREKARAKNKEPKEEIVVDLGERKNKTAKNDKRPSGASIEDVFDEERRLSTKGNSEKIRENEGFANNVYREEPARVKLNWLDGQFENRIASENSQSVLEDNYEKKIGSNEPLEYISNARIDINPDVIENILLDIQPIKILEQGRELEASKDAYEDFGNERPEDRYYYQENDRRYPNNVEPLYEELKNVYDWPDGELKRRPRLRGDQRLRYESDDKLDTNPSQLQALNDRFLGSSQNDDAQRRFYSASWTTPNGIPASNYFALKVTDDMFKGGPEQSSSTKENSSNIFSVRTTESKVSKIVEDKNNSFPMGSAAGQSVVDTDSRSPYENRKYIESKTRELLKRNLKAAISSQDLDESFVESLDWHDDFDDNVKVRFGRGLKAVNEAAIFDSNKTHNQDDKSNVANVTNVNSKLHDFSRTFHDNSSISQDWYNNTTVDLINIFNVHQDVSDQNISKVQEPILMNTINMNGNEDLEAVEQKYINNRTPRIRRAAASYRTFYDDTNQYQRDSDDTDRNLNGHFHLPDILEDRSDKIYHEYVPPNWSNDVQDFNRYLKIPRIDSRKKEKPEKRNKNKHVSEKHAKKSSSHSPSSRNRRHHAHRSDMSRNVNRDHLKPKKKNKAETSPLTKRTRIQKSKTAGQGLLRAELNEAPVEKVLYENAEDQSTVKPEEDNARRKEITLLLAADNVDDESQMDVALHGELAGKIVEQIFEQVQKNDRLKSIFGPGLHRDYKTEDVVTAGNIYRQGFGENGTNRTETTMKRVMGLLDSLILNEVQRKTCVSLSPDMQEFLGWMLEVDQEEESLEEAPPLPFVRKEIIPEKDSGRKFLFDSISEKEGEEDISDLQEKARILETLVKEYNALTTKEKLKVQTVHDYLVRQLNLLLRHIEAQEAEGMKGKSASVVTGAARARTGNILQYQSAVPNANYSMEKDTFSSPIDTYNSFRFDNTTFKAADRQLHNSHVTPHHRETRSLGEISSKQHRKTKSQKFRNHKKNENHRKSKQKHRKHRKRLVRAVSSPGCRKSRQKRANLEENDQHSLYLGYEEPTIYDSFDLLDAKLTEKRKRELADKKNVTTENDRMLDLLPIKGKNRVEDEVILLNKREAWRRENEEQLEEVAFGKDMRNSTRRQRERFEKLTEVDKRKPIDETSSRTKREDIIHGASTIRSTDRSNKSHTASENGDGKSGRNSESNSDNGARSEDKLGLVERRINVFVDNKTDTTSDTAATEVSAEEKFTTNAGANNQVKGKLCAINRETKIDKADGSTSFVNLTSDAKPQVSKERRKVSAAEKEADDNAVKLNRATNYRSGEVDPEIELKNLRQGREKRIYGVADWKMTDSFYDDDNFSKNKLREKYVDKLNELVDLDTDPENNFQLRLRSNKWSNDIEWKLLPIISRSPYYDDHALSRIPLTEKETPVLSNIKNVEIKPSVYFNNPKLQQLKHRRRRNGVFNISPMLRIIDNDNSFSRRIHPTAKRLSEISEFKDLQVNPKISSGARKLSRPRNKKRSNSVAIFGVPFILKYPNRELREISRSHNDPELGDRMIYDGVGLRLPVWRYRYYDDFVDSPTFHFVPDILGKDGEVYRYPAGMYLEYGPFKGRARDSNQRFARRNRFRLRTSEREAADFPEDNLANKSRFARGKFRMGMNEKASSRESQRLLRIR